MRIASLPRKLAGGKCRVVGDRATAFEFRRSLSEISIIVSSAAPSPATVASGVWALADAVVAKALPDAMSLAASDRWTRCVSHKMFSTCECSITGTGTGVNK